MDKLQTHEPINDRTINNEDFFEAEDEMKWRMWKCLDEHAEGRTPTTKK